MTKRTSVLIASLLILVGVMGRLLPHAPNITPLTAIALFAAAYLGLRYAGLVILATMVMTDLYIGTYNVGVMAAVYGSLLVIGLVGLLVRKHVSAITIGIGALASSILFFLITNAAVWMFTSMYTHDFAGLMQSYTMALPFFKNSLIGDIGYTAVLFGALELVKYWSLKPAETLAKA